MQKTKKLMFGLNSPINFFDSWLIFFFFIYMTKHCVQKFSLYQFVSIGIIIYMFESLINYATIFWESSLSHTLRSQITDWYNYIYRFESMINFATIITLRSHSRITLDPKFTYLAETHTFIYTK